MITYKIPNKHRTRIVEYCNTNISPRRYYLHNSVGGKNWRLERIIDSYKDVVEYYLTTDEQYQLIITLKYSE